MGCGRSAHADDIREYESLCVKYGEKPFTGGYGKDPDPHSAHANKLLNRFRDEKKWNPARESFADDCREYEALCSQYGEKVQACAEGVVSDPYCEHANQLFRRFRKDTKATENQKHDAREMWDAFEAAYLQCPQKHRFYDDQNCLGYGTVAEMKKNKEKCLKFWMDPESVGGSTLWDTGYGEKLEYHFAKRVKSYQAKIEKAKAKIKF